MKKLITLAISALMVLSLGTTVFAVDGEAEIDSANGSFSEIPVRVTVNTIDTDTVYWVDITWDSLDFEFRHGNLGDWDAVNHNYKDTVSSAWSVAGANSWDSTAEGKVTVTNHSNTSINVTASVNKPEYQEYQNVTVSVSDANSPQQIDTAVGTPKDNAPNKVWTVTVGGTPGVSAVQNATIANVNISIN